jgi:hypothetical protein
MIFENEFSKKGILRDNLLAVLQSAGIDVECPIIYLGIVFLLEYMSEFLIGDFQ